jgi:hypothetical protein
MRLRSFYYHQLFCSSVLLAVFASGYQPLSTLTIHARKAGTQRVENLSIDDPRPIAEAVKLIQNKYGLIITYEDPRFSYEGDLVDKTDPQYRQEHPGGYKALTAKGGHLEINYVLSQVTGKPESTQALLQQVLDAAAAAGHPGRFQIKQTGRFFHVVPRQVKNSRGEWVDQNSILDLPISFPERQRTVFETLETILKAVSQEAGIRVGVGTAPMNTLIRIQTTQGASSEIARDVLIRTLESTKHKLSWRLLYSPGQKLYALNLRGVSDL